jgi:hypothetical protein
VAQTQATDTLVLVGPQNGLTLIPSKTALTRLHYFDGKFLRAADLSLEQTYLRRLVALSNQAGGSGVAYGFDVALGDGDTLTLGPGLAIDPPGRVLLLPQQSSVGLQDLIDQSSQAATAPAAAGTADGSTFAPCPPKTSGTSLTNTVPGLDLYLITIAHAEALCGDEEVFSQMCEAACATTTDHAYAVEGVILRALPLQMQTALATSKAVTLTQTHLRSLVASAYFTDEANVIASLISKAGLGSAAWCAGADKASGQGVPLGVLARLGTTTVFLDAWTARRERIDTPAKRYWQWRMAMRPWDVFLAQVLQFQCQLRDLFQQNIGPTGPDPCQAEHLLLGQAAQTIGDVITYYQAITAELAALPPGTLGNTPTPTLPGGLAELTDLGNKIAAALKTATTGAASRILIGGGIVELPSAGYLPVVPGSAQLINDQVVAMLGEGLDLRFCVVRPDYVPHALEEAQHMDRISLLAGLDDPTSKPRVDILVPDGDIVPAAIVPAGTAYEMTLAILFPALTLLKELAIPTAGVTGLELLKLLGAPGPKLAMYGVGRSDQPPSGARAFYFAGAALPQNSAAPAFTLIVQGSVWVSLQIDQDPFGLLRNDSTGLNGELVLMFANSLFRLRFSGNLLVTDVGPAGAQATVAAHVTGSLSVMASGAGLNQPIARALNVSDDVTLVHVSDPTAASDTVFLPTPSLLGNAQNLASFLETRKWNSPSVAQVDGALELHAQAQPAAPAFTLIGPGDTALPLYSSSQTVNPDVLTPDHPAHASAVTALRVLSTALAEPQFQDIAARQLFPPPAPTTGGLLIRGRKDWVLFQRRREKQCAPAAAQPAATASRRYRLYLVQLSNLQDRVKLNQAIMADDGATIDGFKPQPIDIVEFSPGIPTLETSAAQVRADWQSRIKPGDRIVYGAVASQGDALNEGPALAGTRLTTLATTLGPITTVAPDAEFETPAAIPNASSITADGCDGVIILAVQLG